MQSETESTHVVILGWNSQGWRLANDLLLATAFLDVVIVADHPIAELKTLPNSERVTFVEGSPASHQILDQARLASAKAVVVLSDPNPSLSDQDADARAILSALTARTLCPAVHLIAQLRDEENVELARTTPIDELFLVNRYSGVLLSQALQSPGLARFFSSLFESGGGVAFHESAVPDELLGAPFSRAVAETVQRGLGSLAGLRRQGQLLMPPSEDLRLHKEDRLVLLQSTDPAS